MAFFLEFSGPGGDLYPRLREGYRAGRLGHAPRDNPRCPDLVRYEVMEHLGYFVTESSEHFAEYVPWFIKPHRPDLIDRFRIPLDEYPRRCEEQIAEWEGQDLTALAPPEPSHEYAATIMEAEVAGVPAVIYGNVPNHGLISDLPEGCAVEVPCLVDANGVQPTPVRDIPPQLTALMQTNVNVQRLTVEALLTEDLEHVRHAAMLDPRTAATLTLGEIRGLVDELLAAHDAWLPAWARRPRAA
jgi:alpha-galactosidase